MRCSCNDHFEHCPLATSKLVETEWEQWHRRHRKDLHCGGIAVWSSDPPTAKSIGRNRTSKANAESRELMPVGAIVRPPSQQLRRRTAGHQDSATFKNNFVDNLFTLAITHKRGWMFQTVWLQNKSKNYSVWINEVHSLSRLQLLT